jgi:3-deoxy-manno-octulosonate cytidylyltransferase (CMP-KDO synthetase)
MNIIGVIPARYGSTRFPGKPLVMLKGKPLLQWVVEGARKSTLLTRVIVATDDERIQKLCHEIKVDVVMTGSDCPTGTDRLFQATKDINFDVAINIQGDEPLIDETYINPLAEAFLQNPNMDIATLAKWLQTQDIDNPNAVKDIKKQKS